jgi:hypothetical protein
LRVKGVIVAGGPGLLMEGVAGEVFDGFEAAIAADGVSI